MKKLTSTARAAAAHPDAAARVALGLAAATLALLVALMGMTSGPGGAIVYAQATASPSPTETASGPAIKLLNPSVAYDPAFTLPPRAPGSPDNPYLSDRFDGHDRAYHVVAVTRDAPANAVVEAYWKPTDLNEITVGTLQKVEGSNDTWEYFWEIPDSLTGAGTFIVRLFEPTTTGFEEVALDEQESRISQGEETVEMTWPTQNGPIGFYKPKTGFWRAVVDGTASGDALRIQVWYSKSKPGEEVKYTRCAQVRLGALNSTDNTRPWQASCSLAGKDTPSMVTALAAVAVEDDKPQAVTTAEYTQESADAHRVQPYMQRVEQMKVSVIGRDAAGTASYPSGQRRVAMEPRGATATSAPNGCLKFDALITDHLDRPVQGANVDVEIQGPSDQIGFGSDDDDSTTSSDSTYKAPNSGGHAKEGARRCPDYTDTPQDDRGEPAEEQGEHNVPGGPDIKHIESGPGSGVDAASADVAFKFAPGAFRFLVYSPVAGFTDITAWVDDEPIVNETDTREADDDLREEGEASGSLRAQWFPAPMSISFSPRTDSAPVGTCNRYVVRARAGSAVVPNFNVDVHAQGPNNDLDFCDPGDATERRAPDQPTGDTAHQPEDEGESSHKSASPDQPEIQHTEGETDADGNFVIGIVSTATGSTQLSAWGDGEKDQDNDVRASSEPGGTAAKTWAATAADATVRFVNPTPYGGAGTNVSNRRDADSQYHIVARVDLPDVVPGVEFFLGSSGTFTKIGDGVRLGDTDTWELFWDANVPDGSYTLRAQIPGTEKREDRTITVNNQATAGDPRDPGFETAELTRPLNGSGAPFDKGETTVEGIASAGAKGVEFYYTKTEAAEARDSGTWTLCGSVTLPGGTSPQNFSGKCTLATGDAPLDVTGIGALAFICDPATGCQTVNNQPVGRLRHSGDAHRVFGFEANPSVTIEPAEAAATAGSCQRLELRVVDGAGRAIPGANVDVHITGPTDAASFCDLTDGTPRRAPERGGHSASPNQADEAVHQDGDTTTAHTEGETNAGGRFIFGITSPDGGDTEIVGWIDQDDNDENDTGEKADTSVMHWRPEATSKRCTVRGDGGDNVLRGTPRADIICGLGGNDRLIGRGGNDILKGGAGDDVLQGRGGRDVLRGNRGNDRLRGGAAADRLYGGPGRDNLDGGPGSDRCRVGTGGRERVENCENESG